MGLNEEADHEILNSIKSTIVSALRDNDILSVLEPVVEMGKFFFYFIFFIIIINDSLIFKKFPFFLTLITVLGNCVFILCFFGLLITICILISELCFFFQFFFAFLLANPCLAPISVIGDEAVGAVPTQDHIQSIIKDMHEVDALLNVSNLTREQEEETHSKIHKIASGLNFLGRVINDNLLKVEQIPSTLVSWKPRKSSAWFENLFGGGR